MLLFSFNTIIAGLRKPLRIGLLCPVLPDGTAELSAISPTPNKPVSIPFSHLNSL
jgi:hypothetical protein